MKEVFVKSRPSIPTLRISEDMSAEERFQNQTLRPIVKMQHDLLLAHLSHYLESKKCAFDGLSEKERVDFINASFGKDLQFRNTIRGMIIGHFATHEYDQYIRIEADMNKRIIQIVKERIYSNMGELMGKS